MLIAKASGPAGTNRAYLEQLALELDALGLRDEYVEDVSREVKDVIESAGFDTPTP